MLFGAAIECDRTTLSILFILIFLGQNGGVTASIHEYKNEAFIPRFNSFFFHGGSEGLYASRIVDPPKTPTNDDNSKPLAGKSFIRSPHVEGLFYPIAVSVLG